MSTEPPLGKRESQTLEFKQAEVLDRPEKVGREVVAMLNAEGGAVWIGIREEEGRAVELQTVAQASRRSDDLRNSLLDSISPPLTSHELGVEAVEDLIRVVVHPVPERRPYALVRSGGWSFWRRIGPRVVTMTRDEIFPSSSARPGAVAEATRQVIEARRKAAETLESALWLRLQPTRALDIDIQSALFDEIVRNPAATGNRFGGWHFAYSDDRPRLGQDTVSWGWEYPGESEVTAERQGGISFRVAAGTLHWGGEGDYIWPLALLELPVSALRIAARILGDELRETDRIVADLAFFGAARWRLSGGSLGSGFRGSWPRSIEGDFEMKQPSVFTRQDLVETPDLCGFRLVGRLYEAYGIPETEMPVEFDRVTNRLVVGD